MAKATQAVQSISRVAGNRPANGTRKAKASAGSEAPRGKATVHQFSARKYDHMTRMLEDALELAFAEGLA